MTVGSKLWFYFSPCILYLIKITLDNQCNHFSKIVHRFLILTYYVLQIFLRKLKNLVIRENNAQTPLNRNQITSPTLLIIRPSNLLTHQLRKFELVGDGCSYLISWSCWLSLGCWGCACPNTMVTSGQSASISA